MTEDYMKKPCAHCPFRLDVTPFLTPKRGEELAYSTTNPYNSFPCHKTTEHDEGSETGDMLITGKTKECAGFLTLRSQLSDDIPKGFDPSWDIVYADPSEMAAAYDEECNG